jgi:hypothetical protein
MITKWKNVFLLFGILLCVKVMAFDFNNEHEVQHTPNARAACVCAARGGGRQSVTLCCFIYFCQLCCLSVCKHF